MILLIINSIIRDIRMRKLIQLISMYHMVVEKDYMNNLKGSYLAGSVYGTAKFEENIGDNDFFIKSQLFKKYDSKHYFSNV